MKGERKSFETRDSSPIKNALRESNESLNKKQTQSEQKPKNKQGNQITSLNLQTIIKITYLLTNTYNKLKLVLLPSKSEKVIIYQQEKINKILEQIKTSPDVIVEEKNSKPDEYT